MKLRVFVLSIVLLLNKYNVIAQEIEFSKKGGELKIGEKVIALLDDEKKGVWNYKNYYLMTTEKKALLNFTAESFKDTTDPSFESWYRVTTPDNALNFTIPIPDGLNTYKAVAKTIIDKKIINNDGTINTESLSSYAKENPTDFKVIFDLRNDSIIKLISIVTQKIERSTRKPAEANDFGNVGQDNKVIGKWEYSHKMDQITGHIGEETFILKNLQGGIVLVARQDITGMHIHTFNGKKRQTDWISSPSDAMMLHTNQNHTQYASLLANYAVKKDLL